VKALKVILNEKDKRALERNQNCNVEAYEFYLRGRQFFHQFRKKGYEFALQMFRGAIIIDPGYALAHAGIADCHSLLYMYWDSSPTNLQRAGEAARKALALDPNLAEAHVARGLAASLSKNFAEAEEAFRTAIRLDGSLYEARYFFGRTLMAQGKLEEAAREYEQACTLRPDDYQAATHLVSIYAGLGRDDQAVAAGRRAGEIPGRRAEPHPRDARALYLGAIVWCKIGEVERGLEWAGRALAMDPDEPVTLYNVACLYALQGQIEPALDCLENAVRHGFAHKEWIEH